jgi:hypothetical protein
VVSVAGKTGAIVLIPADVGAAAAVHTHGAADVVSGVFTPARLGTGTADATTILYGDGAWKTAPTGGGVTGFVASDNTASPNNTVNAARLFVNSASANADAVIQPKGTGALLAQLPDGTAAGGNKRGLRAIDFQLNRGAASQVASGSSSAILYGISCTASGAESLAGGNNCSASASQSISLGASATASGNNSVAIGNAVMASGQNSVAFGSQSQATGVNSVVIGDYALADRTGMYAFASGPFATRGDCQQERYIQRRQTTDATQTELSTNGAAPAAATRIAIATDSTYAFSALITARRTDADNESAGYKIEGVIDNNAGTTAFVGTPTVTVLSEDTAAWDVVAEADNTNDALVFKVTGEAAKTIRWGASIMLMKITG